MIADAVIVGRAVGFDMGDFMPGRAVPDEDRPCRGALSIDPLGGACYN